MPLCIMPFFIMGFLAIIFLPIMGFLAMGFMVEVWAKSGNDEGGDGREGDELAD